ncbi:MAG: OmpA family protein [Bacteroidales bacterium]|nr:OmpA family protein [Bacteroidales bacterium]
MRKLIISAVFAALGLFAAGARGVGVRADAADNWSVGVDAGVAVPVKGAAFFGDMRGTVGVNVDKAFTPVFGLGAEAWWGVNTSSWRGMTHSPTAFDNSYVGLNGTLDMVALVRGRACDPSRWGLGITAGAGWGHYYRHGVADHNYFATKVGLLFTVRLCESLSLALKPAILWNVSDSHSRLSSATLDARRAIFQLQAGLSWRFGNGFECVMPYDQTQIDGLNGQINDLRGRLDSSNAALAEARAVNTALQSELDACRSAKPEVIREVAVDNRLNTVVDVFFLIGSSTITRDQLPNVERIAAYLNNHPGSRVVIKGYASRDGDTDANLRLAQRRADAVRTSLISRYKISPDRISAQGAGIGDMFEEESWNRVSVCTLENNR